MDTHQDTHYRTTFSKRLLAVLFICSNLVEGIQRGINAGLISEDGSVFTHPIILTASVRRCSRDTISSAYSSSYTPITIQCMAQWYTYCVIT